MSTINEDVSMKKTQKYSAKKAVPVTLLLFLLCLVIDNSFKIISVDMAKDFHISATTVSWQATLAGLVIGIGAVVYAALADSISFRKLFSAGIILICVGSVMGYIFQHSFLLVVISRIIQTAGLASAETLYVIFVTKHLPADEQKKFLGLSTSSFALSQLIGALTGGYVSTYFHWTTLFLLSLVTLFTLPFILKYIPKEEAKNSHVDVLGLFLVGAISASLLLYITDFNWLYLVLFIVAIALFLTYISKNSKAFIGISFFQNKQFISLLGVAFIIYSVQLAYIFLFPFLLEKIYGLQLDTISLLLIPGYIAATIVGALSGKVAKVMGSKQCITLAMSSIIVSLLLGGFFINTSVVVFVISMVLFSSSFAFMYAPLLDSCICTIEKEKTGTAIGFYNLTLNVAMSIGIAYTAAMMDHSAMKKSFFGMTNNVDASMFSNILFILVLVTLFSLSLYWVLVGRKATK
ncbi:MULTISPECIES: MFS transporter [Bacillus]|uniref:MFS transporter n=1 Tax=Bacillus pseudomycoides TaxID=64104 RepID=A0AAJ3R8Q1_9BACI|nr:MFS transporter [Bacillus pseudomycoides]EEM06605.1 Tetracycline resistance protein [Bacillus pseudomycoides]EEM08205.1 Tetracycline resistance protein [Bacillus pseudomycoides]KFN14826.1 major Facilitator Superfamily protein [Bacillus pseudomycoides]MBD5799837.1 multidrug MFS transporter [Bacillus pseudomycoides]MCR8855829.1 MFS transporter [Bacillus pseudomycoides]